MVGYDKEKIIFSIKRSKPKTHSIPLSLFLIPDRIFECFCSSKSVDQQLPCSRTFSLVFEGAKHSVGKDSKYISLPDQNVS